jgi:hypothetical protein
LKFWRTVSPKSRIAIHQHKSIFRVGTRGRFAEQIIKVLYSDALTALERKRSKANAWI